MNRLNRSLYLLPVALLAIACGRAEGHGPRDDQKVTIARQWSAANIRDLHVFEVDGSVSIDAAQTNEITLIATAIGDFEIDKKKENDGLFATALEGNTLRIGRRERHHKGFFNFDFSFGRSHRRIDYVLHVPRTVSLDLSTVNGRIATRGVDGAIEAATVNGGIGIETAGTQELRASTVNGRVRAKFLQSFQGARFKTVNGGVEAILPQNASFNVDLSQVNGDFEASFPLSIHSNPGSRRVSGEVNGGQHALKITTVNGDVQLARLNEK